MSDGDRPRVGPPVIHVTTSDQSSDEEVKKKPDEASARQGHRDVQSYPGTDKVVRRSKSTLSQSGRDSRRVTLVDGHRSLLSVTEDQIATLSEDDEAGVSDMDVTVLKTADIKMLEDMLSRISARKSLPPDQIKQFVEQLYRDVANFKKVASGVKKRLQTRRQIDEEVKQFILDQSAKIVKYCNLLEGKLGKVQKSAKKGYSSVQLKSGASGMNYKGDDLSVPKSSPPESDLIESVEIICDGYKQLLAISRFWKMEWPSFDILTGVAASYAGIDIKSARGLSPELDVRGDIPQELIEGYREISTRLNELGSLANQLKELADDTPGSEQLAGVRELLGTIFPDADSKLEPMPMDYFYAMGGNYTQKSHPMEIFGKRLARVNGEILTLRRDVELALRSINMGKARFLNLEGQSTDAATEYDRLREELDKMETKWSASYPSVQRLYTERVQKRRTSRK